MVKRNFVGIAAIVLLSGSSMLKPTSTYRMKVSEPSDICSSTVANEFILLADKAFVYKVKSDGSVISKLDFSGYDLEAICSDDNNYYISEETFKEVYVLDKQNFQLKKTIPVPHEGGRNEGIEAMVYFPNEKTFILSTEKDPQIFLEMNSEMQIQNTFQIEGIDEVSAMTWHNNKWYVLSDEASSVYIVDFVSKKITAQYRLPIINPEGITFTSDGKMIIVSDDMAKVFQFTLPSL